MSVLKSYINAHDEVIWDITHHPYKNLLLSSGSDGLIKLWNSENLNENS